MATDDGEFTFAFGNGVWEFGETTRRGPYRLPAKAAYVGLPPLQVAGAYAWDDERTLRLILRYIESPHTATLIARFDGDNVSLTLNDSIAPGSDGPTVEGVRSPSTAEMSDRSDHSSALEG
jgi:hypothetical protein